MDTLEQEVANVLNSLGAIPEYCSQQFGGDTALIFEDETWTYEQLNTKVKQTAAGLKALGVKKGDRVTLFAPNSPDWVAGYYAILRANAVVNPLNFLLTAQEVEFAMKNCGARTIIVETSKANQIIGLSDECEIENIIVIGNDVPSGCISLHKLICENTGDSHVPTTGNDELSTIVYTSGTTGMPKGTMLSHRNVLINAEMTALMHVRTSTDVVVSALPLPHVYGNIVMNSTLMHGGTLILHALFDADAVLESIERYGATMFEGVPTMYYYLLDSMALDRTDLSSLTRCTVGGQTIPIEKIEDAERHLGCPLLELWGMTEMAGLGSTHPYYGNRRPGSIGIALPFARLKIVDVEDASKNLAVGEVGELMAAGPQIMMGYYDNEDATNATIESDGWLHTGDLAYTDEDGYFYIVDRKKDLILTAGYNVYPAEIERVIASHPAVAMVAVGRVHDHVKGELAKAYVVAKSGAALDEDELMTHCRNELAAYKVPRAIQFVDDLPKTSTGKLLRRGLKELDA